MSITDNLSEYMIQYMKCDRVDPFSKMLQSFLPCLVREIYYEMPLSAGI